MNIEQYRKRFFDLMESTIGDVKPLIVEENEKVFIIPPLSNLPEELRNNKNDTFDGTCKDNVLTITGLTTPIQIYTVKSSLDIGTINEFFCFLESSEYAKKLKITDVKENSECFVIVDVYNKDNCIIYTDINSNTVIKKFDSETWAFRNTYTENSDKLKYYIQNIYKKLRQFEPFKSNPSQIVLYIDSGKILLNFKNVNGEPKDFIIAEKGRERSGGQLYVYLGLFEKKEGKYVLNEKIGIYGEYPLNTVISFQENNLIPGKDGKQ
jgi:hypothetical protein